MYKLYKLMGEDMPSIPKEDGGVTFICSKDCNEYQAYLKWLEESPDNKPLPADS